MKTMDFSQKQFLRKWMILNWLGWLLGLVAGPVFFILIIRNISDLYYYLDDIWEILLVALPFGISLGSIQQILLRRWNVPFRLWILATGFGIAIPATFIFWFHNSGAFAYDSGEFLPIIVELVIMGLGIGSLQALVLRKQVASVSGWVWAYSVGFLILGIAALGIASLAFLLAEPIQKFFYFLGLWQLVENRDLLLYLSIVVTLPVIAALVIGIPTGRILQKFDNTQISIERRDEKKRNESLEIY